MTNRQAVRAARTPSGAVGPQILQAAYELLKESGDVTMRSVAERAAVALMSVYNHFGDKQGVIDAVVDRCFKDLSQALRGANQTDPRARLRAAGLAFREVGIRSPRLFRLMWSRVNELPPEVISHSYAPDSFLAIVEVVRYCQIGGTVREGDPFKIASNLWACVWGAVSLELDTPTNPELIGPRIDFDELLETLLIGFAPPTSGQISP